MRLLFAFVGVMVACLTPSVSPGADGRARSILMLDQGGAKSPFYHDVFTGLRVAGVWAENLVGGGAVFHLSLPLAKEAPE